MTATLPAERFGKFLRAGRLGGASSGEVWKAYDTQLSRWVALKLLHAGDAKERARFAREAQTVARLSHPDIATLYEFGEVEGQLFIALQYIDGATLRTFPRTDRRVSVRLLRDAARAVSYANESGVIHRDVKPENIMVSWRDNEPHVTVLDFGLARAIGTAQSLSGPVIGTPGYMPPEQARGETADTRSDVYGLGATLYEMLTGHPPFRGRTVLETLRRVLHDDPTPPRRLDPGIERDLETIVLKCLEKDRDRRYASTRKLAEDLSRWLERAPILAHPPSTIYRLTKLVARRPAIVIAAAAALALGGGFLAWPARGRPELEEKARYLEREAARARDQQHAYRLLEAGRPAIDTATQYLYRQDASYEELVRRVDEGQPLIEQALRKAPHLALGHYLLGRAWEIKGWRDRADQSLRRALELDPSFGPAHYRLGRLLASRAFMMGRWTLTGERASNLPEAQRAVREAAVHLETAACSSGTPDEPWLQQIARAIVAHLNGDRAIVRRIAQEGAAQLEGREGVEEFHWLAGLAASDPRERIQAFTRALEVRPKFIEALFYRALERQHGGDFRGSIADFDELLRISPRLADVYLTRGIARTHADDFDGAIRDFDDALRLNPTLGAAAINRAMARQGKGDLDGALADCEEAFRISPNDPGAYFARANTLIAKGDLDGALHDYDTLILLVPSYAVGFFDRGIARHKKGDLDGALRDYSRAIELNPRYLEAYVNRGNAWCDKTDFRSALADYRRALALAPPSSAIRATLESEIAILERKP